MLAPVMVFMGLCLAMLFHLFTKTEDLEATRVGQIAPPVTDVALNGYAPVLPETMARGEVTLVNFWASWCPPCRAEHPKLLELQAAGVPIVGINFKDRDTDAVRYLEDAENPFVAVAYDPSGRSAIDWGVTAPPETFILDGDGVVLYRFVGPLVGSDFENRFLPELQKAMQSEGVSQ